MSSVELRSKTELTSITGTENVYIQESGSPFTVKRVLLNTIKSWFMTAPSSTVLKTAAYDMLDNDGITRIEADTTTGPVPITLPLMANNRGRRVEIAFIKNDASADVVTVSPHATDTGKLSNDLLASMILAKVGDFIVVQESVNSGCWEVVNERITNQLRLNTYAGYGNASNNKIPYFTNVIEEYGNMFTKTSNDNVTGLVLTVNRSGRYGISFYSRFDSACYIGISLNSAQLTTAVGAITTADRLGASLCGAAGDDDGVTVSLYFKKGDVIRPHTDGVANSGGASRSFFSISYLGQ